VFAAQLRIRAVELDLREQGQTDFLVGTGDAQNGSFAYPLLLRDLSLAALRNTPDDAIVVGLAETLQILPDRAHVVIELESRQLTRTLRPRI